MIDLAWPEFLVLMVGLALVVTCSRLVFLYLPASWRPRGGVERALRYAPLAALVALTVPHALAPVLVPDATLASIWVDRRLPAAVVLLIAAAWTRNPFIGLASGAAVYLLV
jgi:branched-subunit amino acid transport protein